MYLVLVPFLVVNITIIIIIVLIINPGNLNIAVVTSKNNLNILIPNPNSIEEVANDAIPVIAVTITASSVNNPADIAKFPNIKPPIIPSEELRELGVWIEDTLSKSTLNSKINIWEITGR